jgi:hypothetical protein
MWTRAGQGDEIIGVTVTAESGDVDRLPGRTAISNRLADPDTGDIGHELPHHLTGFRRIQVPTGDQAEAAVTADQTRDHRGPRGVLQELSSLSVIRRRALSLLIDGHRSPSFLFDEQRSK